MTRLSGLEAEDMVLSQITPALESEGYQIIRHPSRSILPEFMKNYHPDAIALGKNKNIAIEIKSRYSDHKSQDESIDRIKKIFEKNDQWEFRLFVIDRNQHVESIVLNDHEIISQSIIQLHDLMSEKQFQAAFLMGWSAFESLGRGLLKGRFLYPQPSVNLISALAEEGYLVPMDADFFRELMPRRNMLAHGQLNIEPDQAELSRFIDVLNYLLALYK